MATETVQLSIVLNVNLCHTIILLQDLAANYSHVRKTRGDGNCFFRAFGYAYLEQLLGDKVEYERLMSQIEVKLRIDTVYEEVD